MFDWVEFHHHWEFLAGKNPDCDPETAVLGFGVKYLLCFLPGENSLRVELNGQGGVFGFALSVVSSKSMMDMPYPKYLQLLGGLAGLMLHLALRIL